MPLSEDHLTTFRTLLQAKDILLPNDAERFKANTIPWSLSYDQSPATVLTPSTVTQVEAVLMYIYQTDLKFAVRVSGCGSSSAQDVIISMANFTDVSFDHEREEVTIGAGSTWAYAADRLAVEAPGFVVVGARCSYVGVIGCTLLGGFSWLSQSLGLGSDPSNFIDAHIVLHDGTSLWASTSSDPDLLWAMRGGGGNFGIVTALKLKAHRFTDRIWAGRITYPASSVDAVSEAVSKIAAVNDEGLALHVFVADYAKGLLHGGTVKPSLVIQAFDAHGREHAESEAGFKLALDIDGASVQCSEMDLMAVNNLQNPSGASHGQTRSWLQAATIPSVDSLTVRRAWDWYVSTVTSPSTRKFAPGTFALLEIMQAAAMTNSGSDKATAWPHFTRGRRHVLQLSVGCASSSSALSQQEMEADETTSLEILAQAPQKITAKKQPPDEFLPNFYLPHHDVQAMYGENWTRLREVKGRYDPLDKINGGIPIAPLI